MSCFDKKDADSSEGQTGLLAGVRQVADHRRTLPAAQGMEEGVSDRGTRQRHGIWIHGAIVYMKATTS